MAGLTDPLILVPGHPPHPFRHHDLEPCALARFNGLADDDAGEWEDLP